MAHGIPLVNLKITLNQGMYEPRLLVVLLTLKKTVILDFLDNAPKSNRVRVVGQTRVKADVL